MLSVFESRCISRYIRERTIFYWEFTPQFNGIWDFISNVLFESINLSDLFNIKWMAQRKQTRTHARTGLLGCTKLHRLPVDCYTPIVLFEVVPFELNTFGAKLLRSDFSVLFQCWRWCLSDRTNSRSSQLIAKYVWVFILVCLSLKYVFCFIAR